MLSLTLLPSPVSLEINQMEINQEHLTGILASLSATSSCPMCGVESTKVQSQYIRRVADLPWATMAVLLILQVRRFFCVNRGCRRKIFTERLPAIVQPYRRRTIRMEKALNVIANAEGAESGARTATELGMKVSADTLLRQLRSTSRTAVASPRVLGVDDFSFRQGQIFGTILVDLEKHERVDLLPDRKAETLAEWMKLHPSIEIISRDRAGAYADGARMGAPQAVQVADRFHLLQNMSETVGRLLLRKHKKLRQVAQSMAAQQTKAQTAAVTGVQVSSPAITITRTQSIKHVRRARRLARYREIRQMYQQGATIRAIARHFHIQRRTVRLFIKSDEYPERATPKRRSSLLDRFLPYLKQRWQAGCHIASQLWQEIVALGFNGSQSLVRHLLAKWRTSLPVSLRRTRGQVAASTKPSISVPSARQVSFWLLDLAKDKDEEKKLQHQSFITRLCNICDEVKQAQDLGKQFIAMVRLRKSDDLDQWLDKAKISGVEEFKHFAIGIERDKAAVYAALKLQWSNGQTEGQINRLKFIKRQMYGRAKFDLLKARVLHQT